MGGYYLPRQGGTTSRWGGGYYLPRGSTTFPGGGYPLFRQGGYPLLEHHSVYLLRGGRYASCVHAGRLSFYVSCDYFSFVNLKSLLSVADFCLLSQFGHIRFNCSEQLVVGNGCRFEAICVSSCINFTFRLVVA